MVDSMNMSDATWRIVRLHSLLLSPRRKAVCLSVCLFVCWFVRLSLRRVLLLVAGTTGVPGVYFP